MAIMFDLFCFAKWDNKYSVCDRCYRELNLWIRDVYSCEIYILYIFSIIRNFSMFLVP